MSNFIGIVVLLLTVVALAAPFVIEFIRFFRDTTEKRAHRRFRILLYSLVYAVIVTVVLRLLIDVLAWLEGVSWLQSVVSFLVPQDKMAYGIKLILVLAVNVVVGLAFVFLQSPVRIGMGKKRVDPDGESEQAKQSKKNKKKDKKKKKKGGTDGQENGDGDGEENGEDGEAQEKLPLGDRIVLFFHHEMFFRIGRILLWVNVILSAVYMLLFLAYELPALFGASWLPYNFIYAMFGAGYVYPTITMLVLWEAYFFLAGIKRTGEDEPELLEEKTNLKKRKVDLSHIYDEVDTKFADHVATKFSRDGEKETEIVTEHHYLTNVISEAIECNSRDARATEEIYKTCLDTVVGDERSLLIRGSFFSDFSVYLLRYLSIIMARGDNVVLVCNNDTQIEAVHQYVKEGLCRMSGVYDRADGKEFDHTVWKISVVKSNANVPDRATADSSVLITTPSYLCSEEFARQSSQFLHLLDTVVFVDTYDSITRYSENMAAFNAFLRNMTVKNAVLAMNGGKNQEYRVRYMSRPVRYLCFNEESVLGMEQTLSNLLSCDFATADCSCYNNKLTVRCLNYEGKRGEDGDYSCPVVLDCPVWVGPAYQTALVGLRKGARLAWMYVDGSLPHVSYGKAVNGHSSELPFLQEDSFKTNLYAYDPKQYTSVVVVDRDNNLPAAVRKIALLTAGQPISALLFSRDYMLRDYYAANLETLWEDGRILRLPVNYKTVYDVSRLILVRAVEGGLTEAEIFSLCGDLEQFAVYVANGNINGVLRTVLREFGVPQNDRINLFRYFEFVTYRDFDEKGEFRSYDRITLRSNTELAERLKGRNSVVLQVGNERRLLPLSRTRLAQNHILRQNMLCEGEVYIIESIDPKKGIIRGKKTEGGDNREAYEYVQVRRYRADLPEKEVDILYPPQASTVGKQSGDVRIDWVGCTVFRAPMEVITEAYSLVDPCQLKVDFSVPPVVLNKNSLEYRLAYRRYGHVNQPEEPSQNMIRDTGFMIADRGLQVLQLRMRGSFGENKDRTAMLAAVMLKEILSAMFPSAVDAIAVCPVLSGQPADEEGKAIAERMSKFTVTGGTELFCEDELSLVIIEDDVTDLGVISALMSDGNSVFYTLFEPVFRYLDWYRNAEQKSDYLYFGLDHEPSCFDFESVYRVAELLGKNKMKMKSVGSIIEYETCDFCGKRYPKDSEHLLEMEDGRLMCDSCSQSLVGNDKKALAASLEQARRFLENTYGIQLGDDYEFCLESTLKIVNTLKENRDLIGRGADLPLHAYVKDKKVCVERDIPAINLAELLVRELTYTWQLKHVDGVREELAEGHIALVGISYLRFLNEYGLATARTDYYESSSSISGEGYRELVKGLLDNPRFCNNPFLYLLDGLGKPIDSGITPPPPHITPSGGGGQPYQPKTPDRATDGNVPMFFRERLSPKLQEAYDIMLETARKFEVPLAITGCTKEEVRTVFNSVTSDHPELYYLTTWASNSDATSLELRYGATAEEVEQINGRIEAVIPSYLEGIDDTMSGYDVAIRLHVKIINAVDYDTIGLQQEEASGDKYATDKIDYLRSICGVFLNGKAVCAGYARAMQFLLQRCGIECAECGGHTFHSDGTTGAHSWNILKLDGDYYYLDATWDDSSNTVQEVKQTELGFDYFCVTTEEMERSRNTDLCPVEMPICTATQCNYYYHNGFVLDSYNPKKVLEIAETMVKSGEKYFTFKCTTEEVFNEAFDRLCRNADDCCSILKKLSKLDKTICPYTYNYRYKTKMRSITIAFHYE